MFIWFVAGSLVAVPMVFDSPDLDIRVVMVAALLPIVEVLIDGPWILHTLLLSVAALAIVMLLTRGHRRKRQRWLGVPIGMFTHLVLDGTWGRTTLFWWPAGGFKQLGGSTLPEFSRFPGTLWLEALGLIVCFWGWKHFGLSQPERRQQFWTEGRVEAIRDR
ncbi:MAG: metal-dependent hydrolase [Acidimicrobiales bacterium]|nr:hypothetical protein [Acidimicrobiaceae bacterium]MDP6077217.1 metal-dependent hydrolase [Acidimicrobiales bacterium]HCV35537.1 hypothetical protein [Acidimicrobiaceae bacterium]HJO79809.1 metal-dependent hydrolase [Acidimicrobiales bacterium]